MAVFSLIALMSSSGEKVRTSFAPVRRMALSNALRPPTMITSCFSPVVSGSCQMYLSSAPAHRTLQLEHVDEMLRCFHLRLPNFRKFQRSAQIGPRASAVDDRLHAQPRVNILSRILTDRRGGMGVKLACCDLAQQWRRR